MTAKPRLGGERTLGPLVWGGDTKMREKPAGAEAQSGQMHLGNKLITNKQTLTTFLVRNSTVVKPLEINIRHTTSTSDYCELLRDCVTEVPLIDAESGEVRENGIGRYARVSYCLQAVYQRWLLLPL